MARELTLDVRGMEPPQPLELVLETIGDFQAGDRLKLVIDCHPTPLFKILDRNGYGYQHRAGQGVGPRNHDLAEGLSRGSDSAARVERQRGRADRCRTTMHC